MVRFLVSKNPKWYSRLAHFAHLLIEEVEHGLFIATERNVTDVETTRLTSHRGTHHGHGGLHVGAGNLAGG